MQLKLYDTLTRQTRDFVPLDWELGLPEAERRVRMYVCGPTVYDFAHIGNARPVIVFDVLFRLLRHLYGNDRVVYVRNITDVDDRINARAAELGVAIRELTERTYRDFAKDVRALGCLPPSFEPRATEYIEPMQAMIERLIDQGNAYVAEEHVLFHVPSMPDYGQLSKRPLDEMIAGARVEVAPYKRNPMDFVLWKPSKPGEPAWPSPAGIAAPGRPGWHIECSAMAWRHLGEMFDIHGGGIDLEFPHHENEIAQSRSAFHTPLMARFWVHNGFLQLEGEKMAKSVGNFITIRELLKTTKFGGRKWPGKVLRFAMLQTHYRQPIDWSVRLLEQAESRLERWLNFAAERTVRRTNKALMNAFLEALANDLNTPAAFSIVDQAIDEETGSDEDRYTVYKIMRLLGVRTKKSRVTRTAEHLEALLVKLGNTSETQWRRIISAPKQVIKDPRKTSTPAFRLAAGLGAIARYWSELNSQHALDLSKVEVPNFASEGRSNAKNITINVKDAATEVKATLRKLGLFHVNEWSNLVNTATKSPLFKSGKTKPETKLLTYIHMIANTWRVHAPGSLDRFPVLMKHVEKWVSEARPRENVREARVRRLVSDRDEARKQGKFGEADRIRNRLAAMGIVLKDSKEGTTWVKR